MTKTPYEIRLDILRMAQDMLESNRRAAINAAEAKIPHNIVGDSMLKGQREAIFSEVTAASAPVSPADIINTANMLYGFVNSRDTATYAATASVYAPGQEPDVVKEAKELVRLKRERERGGK